ncbi:(E)-4-hydroxy-3-methylbut-2-enyl-diphosphate synthase, partial [Bacteroidota bacterium]
MNNNSKIYNHLDNSSNEVVVGGIALGGQNPIRIQSMTNTDTNNIEKSVSQCIDLYNAGTDYVRLTVQGLREVESMIKVQDELRKRNINLPLIADVHFNPKVAEKAAQHFAKVRINPGNYSEKRKGKVDYSEEEYLEELNKIKTNLLPLLNICIKYKTALRIGINHGSLSERIMSKYGDTPEGMVESAMEFLRICRDERFYNVVVSMKSSNVLVMVQSTRLLVAKMKDEEMSFPLHLGVTEAGEGEDGRVKSAIGIGALLNDGIGDTIRVSLTENPVNEIPVAQRIVKYTLIKEKDDGVISDEKLYYNPYNYQKRKSESILNIGGTNPPVVISEFYSNNENLSNNSDLNPDFLFVENLNENLELMRDKKFILKYSDWSNIR